MLRHLTRSRRAIATVGVVAATLFGCSSATIPPGIGARETLLEASAMFFDPGLVPWYVDSAAAMKGDEGDLAPIREASLAAALKLMKADQVTKVEQLARQKSVGAGGGATIGSGFAREISLAKELLATCGDKVDCYARAVGEPRAQTRDDQFVGIKAAYMIGVLGSPATRQGVVALADLLQEIVAAGQASKDPNQIARNAPLTAVIDRLRARAE